MKTTAFLFFTCLSWLSHAQQSSFTVYFDHNKSVPTSQSAEEFTKFLSALQVVSIESVTLKGYADKTGEEQYNSGLSQKRVGEVKQLLLKYIPGVQLQEVWFGEQFLVSDNDEEQNLNRRVEVFIKFVKASKEDLTLQTYYEDVETQLFSINTDDTVSIKGKHGTSLKIPPGSFLKKDSSLMKGQCILILKEYYLPSQILLAGLTTTSHEGLLQTSGMFKVWIIQNGDTALSSTRQQVEIRMPFLNPALTNMNVYEQPYNTSDSALWINTRRFFTQSQAYWNWPASNKFIDLAINKDYNFRNLKTGKEVSEEYHPKAPFFEYRYRPYSKKVKVSVKKTDSITLEVRAQIIYRRKGTRILGIRSLDTVFKVRYIRQEYAAWVNGLNFINCDRFYKENNPTEFIVQTPGFKGMNVMLYFRKLNAFMNAAQLGDRYFFPNVPIGQEVYVIAIGKQQNAFYYGQQQFTIQKDGQVSLDLSKTNLEQCKKNLSELN